MKNAIFQTCYIVENRGKIETLFTMIEPVNGEIWG
jgi:hypothetical protein